MNIQITVEAPGLVNALESLAAALANQPIVSIPLNNTSNEAQKESQKKAETPMKETAKQEPGVKAEESEPTKLDEPGSQITLVTVRGYLQKLQDAGRQKDAKAILTDLGHKKLSDVPKEDYQTILDKVEELLA